MVDIFYIEAFCLILGKESLVNFQGTGTQTNDVHACRICISYIPVKRGLLFICTNGLPEPLYRISIQYPRFFRVYIFPHRGLAEGIKMRKK